MGIRGLGVCRPFAKLYSCWFWVWPKFDVNFGNCRKSVLALLGIVEDAIRMLPVKREVLGILHVHVFSSDAQLQVRYAY